MKTTVTIGLLDGDDRRVMKSSKSPLKYWVVVASFLAMGLSGSAVYLSTLLRNRLDRSVGSNGTSREVCTTKECVEMSTYIMNKIDFSVDPCENMYLFSCGKLITTKSTPFGVGMITQIDTQFETDVLKIISSPDNMLYGKNSSALAKAKLYLNLCKDEETIEKKMKSDILQLLSDLGSWTVTNQSVPPFDPTKWDFQTTMLKLHKMSVWPMFQVEVMKFRGQPDNSTSFLIYFKVNDMEFDRLYFTDPDFRSLYARLLVDHLGGDEMTVTKKLEEVAEMTAELAYAQREREKAGTRFNSSQIFLLKSLPEKTYSWLNFRSYLNQLFDGIALPDDLRLFVQERPFMGDIDVIFKKYSKESLANYLLVLALDSMRKYLPSSMDDRHDLKRDQFCFQQTMDFFGGALVSAYVEKFSSLINKSKIITVAQQLKQQMVESIRRAIWLEESVRSRLLRKARGVEFYLGYPDWILDANTVENYYSNVKVEDGEFFYATRSAMEAVFKRRYAKELKETFLPNDETHVRRPVFDSSKNTVFLTVNMMQPPLTGPHFPNALFYGSIGNVLGHEISHPFDTKLRKTNEMSLPLDVWSNRSDKEYTKRAVCLADSYNSRMYCGVQLKGNNTVAEDVGDNSGLRLAYQAFKKHGMTGEPTLPGLNLTDEQLFFVGFSQIFCEKTTCALERVRMFSPSHNRPPIRVNVTLSNFQPFADAFNCPRGSEMNPEIKCTIWK